MAGPNSKSKATAPAPAASGKRSVAILKGRVQKAVADKAVAKAAGGRKGKICKELSDAQLKALDFMGFPIDIVKKIETYEELDHMFATGGQRLTKFRQEHGPKASPATGNTKYVLGLVGVEVGDDVSKEAAYDLATATFPTGIQVYQLTTLCNTFNVDVADVKDLSKAEAAEMISELRREDAQADPST